MSGRVRLGSDWIGLDIGLDLIYYSLSITNVSIVYSVSTTIYNNNKSKVLPFDIHPSVCAQESIRWYPSIHLSIRPSIHKKARRFDSIRFDSVAQKKRNASAAKENTIPATCILPKQERQSSTASTSFRY